MLVKTTLASAALLGGVHAQANDYWFIPPGLTDVFCNGLSRPDWAECEQKYVESFSNTEMKIGPAVLDGQVFTYDKCQVSYVMCGNNGPEEWTESQEGGLFGLARNSCGDIGAGVQRQGSLCVIVEDPNNPLERDITKRAVEHSGEIVPSGEVVTQTAWPASENKNKVEERSVERSHARDLSVPRDLITEAADLEARQGGCSGDSCFGYIQQGFAAYVRGPMQYVCNSVLLNEGLCAEGNTVTITDSYEVTIGFSAGIKDAIDVSASFTTSYSEAISTSLTVTNKLDCPGGKGYIVWWPYMEVSMGECTEGTCDGGNCRVTSRGQCETSKPIVGDGKLTGEYGSQCI